MAIASVSGLISGLDTANLISQLMQVEAQPQTMLKTRVSSEQTSLSALQSLNTKLTTVVSKAQALSKTADWSPLTVTSSSEHVTASVTDATTASSLSFKVVNTAVAHQESFGRTALTTRVTSADSTTVRLGFSDGSTVDIETGDGTLGGLVKAVNAADAGVRASTVTLDDGTVRVRIESEKTGVASAFTLKELKADGTTGALAFAPTTSRTGQDATIDIGGDIVKSATNTFSGVVSGLDITLAPTTPTTAPDNTVFLTVSRDTEAVTDAVQAMVDAANAVLTDIAGLTSYDSKTKKAGPLAGDSTLRSLRDQVISAVTSGVSGKTLAAVGVEVDRDGNITFDAEAFEAAYAADPTGTARMFAGTGSWNGSGQVTLVGTTWRTTPGPHTVDSAAGTIDGQAATVNGSMLTGKTGGATGLAVTVTGTAQGTLTYQQGLAAKLAAIAERASDSTVGSVTLAIKGRTSTIDSLEDAIADWDVRLEIRRESLQRQYAALEVALGQMQNQSQWLAGQIAGLPTMSSGS